MNKLSRKTVGIITLATLLVLLLISLFVKFDHKIRGPARFVAYSEWILAYREDSPFHMTAGDDEDTLSARILGMEHRLFPLALRLVATGAARLEGGRVIYAADAPAPFLAAFPDGNA